LLLFGGWLLTRENSFLQPSDAEAYVKLASTYGTKFFSSDSSECVFPPDSLIELFAHTPTHTCPLTRDVLLTTHMSMLQH
jgi:hypothetical protein